MKRVAKQVAVGSAMVLSLFLMPCAALPAGSAFAPQSQGATDEAAAIYAKSCAKCHGKDGRAKSFRGKMTRARNFTDAEWQQRASDDTLAFSIANGRGSMPAFKKKLTAEQIDELVVYIRQFKKQ